MQDLLTKLESIGEMIDESGVNAGIAAVAIGSDSELDEAHHLEADSDSDLDSDGKADRNQKRGGWALHYCLVVSLSWVPPRPFFLLQALK